MIFKELRVNLTEGENLANYCLLDCHYQWLKVLNRMCIKTVK